MSPTTRPRRQYAILLFAMLGVAGIVAASIWRARNHPKPYTLDYSRFIHLDAEDLAEGGIVVTYRTLQPELRKYVPEPAKVEESTDDTAVRYSVTWRGREFVIYGPGDDRESWGRATFAFFTIVNDQLAQTKYRFYAINGGNDLGGMFLTEAQAEAAREGLSNKSDWPYLPDNRPPFYGQPH
jgi:hypothetical protein